MAALEDATAFDELLAAAGRNPQWVAKSRSLRLDFAPAMFTFRDPHDNLLALIQDPEQPS